MSSHFWPLFAALICQVLAQDAVGCGGFVQLGDSQDISGHLSRIRIQLTTLEGAVKEETEPAPNGYWFIPNYGAGRSLLKIVGPDGWDFNPSSIELEPSTECTAQKQHSFKLTGFSVHGHIAIDQACSGSAEKVTLQLGSEQTVLTDNKGQFLFKGVLPGEYTLKASKPGCTLNKSSATVRIGWGNEDLAEAFRITGYTVGGTVVTLENDVPVTVQLTAGKDSRQAKMRAPGVPCGSYTLTAQATAAAHYLIEPSTRTLEVRGDSISLAEAFSVKGFTLSGRVTSAADGVVVSSGALSATTGADGTFSLSGLRSGTFKISAKKQHYGFSEVTVTLNSSSSSLPTLIPSQYDLCGQLDDANSRVVRLLADGKSIAETTAEGGRFCFPVEPGQYQVEPVVEPVEAKRGLAFGRTAPLKVTAEPVLSLRVSSVKVPVSGRLECLTQDCHVGTTLTLSSTLTSESWQYMPKHATFIFPDILPGQYILSASHPGWCWKNNALPVTVQSAAVNDLVLAQSGFELVVSTPHPLRLLVNGAQHDLTAPSTTLCVPTPGQYTLKPVSCFKYASEEFAFDTAKAGPVDLTPLALIVSGSLHLPGGQVSSSFDVVVKPEAGTATFASGLLVQEGNLDIWRYSFSAKAGGRVSVEPSPLDGFYWSPPAHAVTVTADATGCAQPVPDFILSPSREVSGTISPALDGVLVRLLVDGKPIAQTKSIAGRYRIGGLQGDPEYALTAELEGYEFRAISGGNFEAFKLGTLSISTVVGDSPLAGVIVSLTSAGGFVKNAATPAEGTLKYYGLEPGSYYVKPILKEYVFEPSQQTVTIADGDDVAVRLKAKRVAYSVFGRVTALDGTPVKGIQVLATSTSKSQQEEALTDLEGRYRLRGLLPGTQYSVFVPSLPAQPRSSPASVSLPGLAEDTHDVNFVVVRLTKHTLSGSVSAAHEHLSTMTVTLQRGEEKRTYALTDSPYFEFLDLQPLAADETITLSVSTSKPHHLFSFSTEPLEVKASDFKNEMAYVRLQSTLTPREEGKSWPNSAELEAVEGGSLPLSLLVSIIFAVGVLRPDLLKKLSSQGGRTELKSMLQNKTPPSDERDMDEFLPDYLRKPKAGNPAKGKKQAKRT